MCTILFMHTINSAVNTRLYFLHVHPSIRCFVKNRPGNEARQCRLYSMTILVPYPTQKLLGVRMAEFRVVLLAHWSKEKSVLKLLQDTETHKEMSI